MQDSELTPTIPAAPDIEKALLSLALTCPDEVMAKLHAAGVNDESFYVPAHRKVWGLLCRFFEEGQAVDVTILAQALTDSGDLKAVGGLTGLSDIQVAGGALHMLDAYSATLAEKEQERRATMAIFGLYQQAKSGGLSAADITGKLADIQNRLDQAGKTSCRVFTLKETMKGVMGKLERQIKQGTHIEGATTGFPKLDDMLGGMRAGGGYYLLAARPGEGKTAIALNIALAVAEQGKVNGGRVLFVSAEMSPAALGVRLLSAYTAYSWQYMCKEGRNKRTQDQILKGIKNLDRKKIDIMQAGGSVEECAAAVKREARRGDLLLAVVDYAQLFTSDKAKAGNRVEELEQVSGAFRALANALPCPLLLLAQVNRAADKAADKRPSMADLKGSGAFEQDAEAVMLLHRPEAHAKTEAERAKCAGQADLLVAKNRNGETGIIPLVWSGATQTFTPAPEPQD